MLTNNNNNNNNDNSLAYFRRSIKTDRLYIGQAQPPCQSNFCPMVHAPAAISLRQKIGKEPQVGKKQFLATNEVRQNASQGLEF